MAEQGYSRTLTFVVNDKQIKRATDRLFQSLDRIEKKLDVIAGRGRGSRTGFIEVQKQIEGTNKELALLTKTASTAQSKFNNLEKTFELFSKAVYGLNQARLSAQKGFEKLTDVATTGFFRLNKEIGKTYLMLDPKKRVQLGGQFKDLIKYRSMQGAGPGSPQFRNDGRLRGSGYSTRKSLAGIGGDGPYSLMYPVNRGGFGGNTFRYEMNKRLALRQQGLERGGTGFASFSRDADYESAWQREFRARLQHQVDRRNLNQAKNLQVQTARLSTSGVNRPDYVLPGTSIRPGSADPVAKSIRRHREKMDKLRKVELKTTKQLLGTEKQIVAVKKTQAIQVNATAYAPGAIGPQQSLYNRLGFGKAANPQGVFANSRGIAGRRANAVSSGMIGGGFPLLFGQSGLASVLGGVGGAAGGLLGGGFGFAGSIVATAAAQKIQEMIDFRKAIADLNKEMKFMGLDAEFSAEQIAKLGKSLGVTKQEALEMAKGFKRYGGKAGGLFAEFFGDAQLLEVTTGARDIESAIAAIKAHGEDMTPEAELRYRIMLQTKGVEETINALVEKRIKRTREAFKEQQEEERKRLSRSGSGGQWGGGIHSYLGNKRLAEELEEQIAKEKELLEVFEKQRDVRNEIALSAERQAQSVNTAIESVEKELRKLNNVQYQIVQAANSIGNSFSESFKGIVTGSMTAQDALRNLFQRTADHFLDMAAQIMAAQIRAGIMGMFANAFGPSIGNTVPSGSFGSGSGTMGSGFGSAVDTNIGRHVVGHSSIQPKALGGPVSGGSPYIVGEKGPELFVPSSSGNIVPNHAMGGTNVVVNVDASGSAVQGDRGQAEELGSMLAAAVQAEIANQQRPGGLLAGTR